jgi:hypothetical protein
MRNPGAGLGTVWSTRKRPRVDHTAHSPYYYGTRSGGSGPVFDDQMALFSVITVSARKPKWPCIR